MALAQRSSRLSDEKAEEIVRLAIRQTSQAEIARLVGVNRGTVRRVLRRTRATLTLTQDTEQDRAEAVAVLREVQRTAWEELHTAREAGRSITALLAEVRMAQKELNGLLGLSAGSPDDPTLLLEAFKRSVLQVVASEAPQLGPKIAERLLEVRREQDR